MRHRRRAAATLLVLVLVLVLAGCGTGRMEPTSQRGFFGGLVAWISGADRSRARALEAEAAGREQMVAEARRRADRAALEVAHSQGETIAVQRLAQSPSAAAELLRNSARDLEQMNVRTRHRLEALTEQNRAIGRGLLSEARLRAGQFAAREEIEASAIRLAQAEGIAGQLMPAAQTASGLRAPLAALQEQRRELGAAAGDLRRAIDAIP